MVINTNEHNKFIMDPSKNPRSTNSPQQQGLNSKDSVTVSDSSSLLINKCDPINISQHSNTIENKTSSTIPTSLSTSDMSKISSSLPVDYDSTSLNPRATFRRAFSSVYTRLIKVMTEDADLDNNRVDYAQTSRFGSCNEFTIGMSPSPRHSRDQSSSHKWYNKTRYEGGGENVQKEDGGQRCTNHDRRKSSFD